MSGITSRVTKAAVKALRPAHASGFRRGVATAAVAVALLAAGGTTARAAVGPYGPAHANCYKDGVISTTLNFNKIGLGSQWLGWNVHYYDIARRTFTFSTGWHTFASGYGRLGSYPIDYERITPGHYYVYTEYGWNLGSGWSVAGAWAGSYLTGGDYFGVPEGFCRAAPILQTVTGCADYGTGIAALACTSRATRPGTRSARALRKRVRRPESLRAIQQLQRSRTVQRVMHHADPAPPRHTRPTEQAAG
jgi:hypothetical protein